MVGLQKKVHPFVAAPAEGGAVRRQPRVSGRRPTVRRRVARACLGAAVAAALAGVPACQKTYYNVLESVGIEKRELLVRRVEGAKSSQEEAQETFRDALERFQKTTGYEGGELQDRYEDLRGAYERSEQRAEDVRDRIDGVENVGTALLEEWEEELEAYSDASLRKESAAKLERTRSSFRQLVATMRKAEKSLKPVLVRLRDHVLFLKHNLNANALSSLDAELPDLERDVERLLREMKQSIAEADRFIAQVG